MGVRMSWKDIPSLEGLVVDWDYAPESQQDQRAHVRLDMQVMTRLIEAREIAVKLATSKQTYDGKLVDISEGGLALCLAVQLPVDLPVRVGLVLGNAKIVSRAQVRYVKPGKAACIVGLQFVDLPQDAARYISGLYAAKVLSRIS
jgi:c-di-GMP-binding flagellar brake protein YcgR